MASLKSNTMAALTNSCHDHVHRPGEWKGLYNSDTKELFVHCWDRDANIGKKYLLSNAFTRAVGVRSTKGIIPGYDLYKMTFNSCDMFNRNLHDKQWYHRCGGGTANGESGHENRMAMACVLQNVVNTYKSLGADEDRRKRL
jgi:hypothetical protein